MSRSIWKGPIINSKMLRKIFLKNNLKVYARNATILMSQVDQTVLIYNGRTFNRLFITREKVGFKFGEFSLTRQQYKKKVKKQILKKRYRRKRKKN